LAIPSLFSQLDIVELQLQLPAQPECTQFDEPEELQPNVIRFGRAVGMQLGREARTARAGLLAQLLQRAIVRYEVRPLPTERPALTEAAVAQNAASC
jgi:hypothetical protein